MPIINSVIVEGGPTPSGTKQITTNGIHDVTNYATADVQVPTTAPESYRAFRVDGGKLTNSTTTPWVPLPAGVGTLDKYIFYQAYYRTPANVLSGNIDMSSLTILQLCDYACKGMFCQCYGITSVNLSSLNTINSSYVCDQMFYECTALTSANLSALTQIKGYSSCSSMFWRTGLISLSLPALTTLEGELCCSSMCRNCTMLTSVNLAALKTISNARQACANMFQDCTALASVDMSSLETISSGRAEFNNTFKGCTSLVTVRFPSLKSIQTPFSFTKAFENCTGLLDLWFYFAFTTYDSTVFSEMLTGCTNVTVHFPTAKQSAMSSWSDVTNGFGGTNTTVLFDLVTSLTGADTNTYTRSEKDSTSTATAWVYNNTLYYTSGVSDNTNGVNEPSVGDTIYSDAACTTAVTTIDAIA